MNENNLLIGASYGLTPDVVTNWAASIRSTGFAGDIALIETGPSNLDPSFCEKHDIRIISETIGPHNFDVCRSFRAYRYFMLKRKFSIYNDRFGLIWDFLAHSEKKYRYVITSDVRDVLFQTDPFAWLEEKAPTGLVLGPEWITFKEGWPAQNMRESFGSLIADHIKDETICCAGVIAGTAEAVMDLSLLIYLVTALKPQYYASGGAADQAAMNLIARNSLTNGNIKLCSPEDNFILHAAAFDSDAPYLAAGAVAAKKPAFRDGVVLNGYTGQPFSIVHQYDRIKEWSDIAALRSIAG